jgi:conjugal transfer pilus assembly protein TraD
MTLPSARSEHIFRPIYELNMSTTWLAGAIATPLVSSVGISPAGFTTSTTMAASMLAVSGYYAWSSYPLIKRQMKLSINKKTFMNTSTLRVKNQLAMRMKGRGEDKREVFIGNGFEWGAEHAQRAYQVMDMDSGMTEVQLPFFLRPIVKLKNKETKKLGGSPWIHGMGDEVPQSIVEDTLYGHSFIAGNVGTGKTTLLRLMSINALHLGNVLLILDPKNDRDWKESILKEMAYLGIEKNFYHIHPSAPSKSARIPLLKHYTRITEISDRVAPLMGSSDGSGRSFQDFASGIIYHTANALRYLDEPIRLTKIQQVISSDRRGLAMRVMRKYYDQTVGEGWEVNLQSVLEKISPDKLTALSIYYNDNLKQRKQLAVVDGMIEFALHDEAHYAKMVVTLRPVLTMLTAEPLNELLSPVDDPRIDDPRPIVDMKAVIEKGGCIYISLDSLTDQKSAGFIARLILAELAAVAGERYNTNDTQARRVTICNDEVHASLENNDALLNILAQGRAAQMQMILATQTVSDLEAKSDKATANRFLGLCNNFISMRTTDPVTQEYVALQFSKTSIAQVQAQSGTGNSTSESMLAFSSSYGERLMKTREDMFPQELLGQLPILQYVARLADGRRLKMRLPILVNDDKPGEKAPWLKARSE